MQPSSSLAVVELPKPSRTGALCGMSGAVGGVMLAQALGSLLPGGPITGAAIGALFGRSGSFGRD